MELRRIFEFQIVNDTQSKGIGLQNTRLRLHINVRIQRINGVGSGARQGI